MADTNGQVPLLSDNSTKRTQSRDDSVRAGSIDVYWRSRSRPRLPIPRSQPSLNLQIFVCLVVAFSWVFTTELSAKAQAEGFDAYVLLYMSTSCLSLFRLDVKVRNAEIDPQRGGLMAKQWAAPFMLILWIVCNLSFLWALTFVRISTVTAIFSTNTAFVFVLSYLILNEKSNEWKLLAVGCAVVGVCLATIGAENSTTDDDDDDGDDEDDGIDSSKTSAFIGCLLSALAALLAALYKVVFYYLFGEATTVEVMKFLSNIGLINFACGFIVAPILYFINALHVPSFEDHSTVWILALVSVLCSVFFNLAVNLGVAFTSPLVVSIGMVLGVPLAVIADCVLVGFDNAKHDGLLSVMSILGYLGCFFAVGFMLVPSFLHLQTGRFTSLSTVSVHGGGGDDASVPIVERSISDVFQRTLNNTTLLQQQGRGGQAPPGASYISSFGTGSGCDDEEDEEEADMLGLEHQQPWIADIDKENMEGSAPIDHDNTVMGLPPPPPATSSSPSSLSPKMTPTHKRKSVPKKIRVGLYGHHFKELIDNVSNFGMMFESMSDFKVIVCHIDSLPIEKQRQNLHKNVKTKRKGAVSSSTGRRNEQEEEEEDATHEIRVFGVDIKQPLPTFNGVLDVLVLNNGLNAILRQQDDALTNDFLNSSNDFMTNLEYESSLIVFSPPLNKTCADHLQVNHLSKERNRDGGGIDGHNDADGDDNQHILEKLETELLEKNLEYVKRIQKSLQMVTAQSADSEEEKRVRIDQVRHVKLCPIISAFTSCRRSNYELWESLFIHTPTTTDAVDTASSSSSTQKKTSVENSHKNKKVRLVQLSVLGCYFVACVLYQSIFNEPAPRLSAVPANPSSSFINVAVKQAKYENCKQPTFEELNILYNLASKS